MFTNIVENARLLPLAIPINVSEGCTSLLTMTDEEPSTSSPMSTKRKFVGDSREKAPKIRVLSDIIIAGSTTGTFRMLNIS